MLDKDRRETIDNQLNIIDIVVSKLDSTAHAAFVMGNDRLSDKLLSMSEQLAEIPTIIRQTLHEDTMDYLEESNAQLGRVLTTIINNTTE